MKKIFGKTVILYSIVLLTGCSTPDNSQSRATCLIENTKSDDIMMCFEGDIDEVKSKCSFPNSQAKGVKVTFSSDIGCPVDRGYYGQCHMYGGDYVPFSYASNPDITEKGLEVMRATSKEDCQRFGGDWTM